MATDRTDPSLDGRLGRPKTAIPLLLAYCAALYFPRLGAMPLWEPDEPRYAEIAREMLESGDFVTSRFDDVRYLKKPPLLFWMTAGSFAAFGPTEFPARLPTVLAGMACVVVCYLLTRSMFGGLAGLLGGAACATAVLHLAMARTLRFDGPLSLFVSLALLLFWLGHREDDSRRARWLLLGMYASSALAMLTKGPVGPGLVGLIVLLYLLATRDAGLIRRMHLPLGVLLFVAIAAPWFVCAESANPGLLSAFFLGENVSRFTSGTGGHDQPVWFYIPVLFGGMFPWTGLLPAALWLGVRDARTGSTPRARGAVFCLVWVGAIFVFFSLSGTKLATYVLPAWPALAALVGALLAAFGGHRIGGPGGRRVRAASLVAVLLTVLALGVAGIIFLPGSDAVAPGESTPLAAVLVIGTALATAAILVLLWRRRTATLVLMAAAMGALMAALATVMVSAGTQRSLKPLAVRARAELQPGDRLVTYHYFDREFRYYAQHPLIVVGDAAPEFDFDRQGAQAAGIWVPDEAEMIGWLRSDQRVLVFARRRGYEFVKTQCAPLFVLAERNRIVLFSNRPARRRPHPPQQ